MKPNKSGVYLWQGDRRIALLKGGPADGKHVVIPMISAALFVAAIIIALVCGITNAVSDSLSIAAGVSGCVFLAFTVFLLKTIGRR